MAIAFVQSKLDGITGTQPHSVSFDASVGAGNLLVLGIYTDSSATITVSDNRGNTWNLVYNTVVSGIGRIAFYYAQNVAAGSTTVTVTQTGAFTGLVVAEYSGIATTSSFDQTNSGSAVSSSPSSGNVTTTQADELLVGFATTEPGVTWTAGTNFTLRDANSSGQLQLEDRIVSATGTYAATFTMSASQRWGCGIATFKASAGGGGVTLINRAKCGVGK